MIPLTTLKDDDVAPGLSNLTDAMATPDSGAMASTAQGLNNGVNPHITFEQLLAAAEQKSLEQELSRLETALGTIRNQSWALQSALSGLS